MSNIEKVSKNIKKKLALNDYNTETPNAVITEEPKHGITVNSQFEPSVDNLSYPSNKQGNEEVSMFKPKDIKPAKPKKVKRTFYIDLEIDEAFDKHYAKLLFNGEKVDKSDLITQAIKKLLEDK